jgi:hypothetical protein
MKFIFSLLTDMPGKLGSKLKEMHTLLAHESADDLGEEYMEIYSLYESLSLRKQRDFSPAMNNLRERIEQQLLAEKEIEDLLMKVKKSTLKQKKKCYDLINEHYKVLPRKVQHHYYTQMVHLRHELEGGR